MTIFKWLLVAFISGLTSGCANSTRLKARASSCVAPERENLGFMPKFDLTGLWIADGDVEHPSVYTQHGRDVTDIYNNGQYRHTQHGRFVDDRTLITTQTRVSLADHSTTHMSLTYLFDSPNSALIYWVALDSSSDLAKGQTGVAHIVRDLR